LAGLLLIGGGSIAATYGLASAGGQAIRVWLPLVAGVALLAGFVIRAESGEARAVVLGGRADALGGQANGSAVSGTPAAR
jgi:hypothetical protein